ncbi:hypothetical protein EVAR_11589_1 [Eumeta japonica]|uniref:Uncharacterized protein n=1 Tax=Eumeta variegata TaxID=151549 RepID=A0A4C1X7H6_EUMVA|nr:hypothetical protein EVAR_11589_1 [Eumeta japonica]
MTRREQVSLSQAGAGATNLLARRRCRFIVLIKVKPQKQSFELKAMYACVTNVQVEMNCITRCTDKPAASPVWNSVCHIEFHRNPTPSTFISPLQPFLDPCKFSISRARRGYKVKCSGNCIGITRYVQVAYAYQVLALHLRQGFAVMGETSERLRSRCRNEITHTAVSFKLSFTIISC